MRAGGRIGFTRFLHTSANEALEVFIGRHWKVLWLGHGHTPPSGDAPRRPKAAAIIDPGVCPPLPHRDPRWGRAEEVGRGSGRPCLQNAPEVDGRQEGVTGGTDSSALRTARLLGASARGTGTRPDPPGRCRTPRTPRFRESVDS